MNLASRLEHVAFKDQIIVSKQVRNMVIDDFLFEKIILEEEIKAFKEIKEVYLVLGKKELKPQTIYDTDRTNMLSSRLLPTLELEQFPFQKYHYKLSQKYYNSISFVNILINKKEKQDYDILIEIKGTIKKGFFDILIIDSEGNEEWLPYNETFDTNTWTGILELKDEPFSIRLTLDLSKYLNQRIRTFILIFEDSDGAMLSTRKVVAGFEIIGFYE